MEACPSCDRRFQTSRGMRVHHSRAHGEQLPNRTCARCETAFYSEHEKKYCSPACRDDAVSFAGPANPNYRGAKEATECELCGEPFEFYPSDKRGQFCAGCVESEQWRTMPSVDGENNPRWNGGKVELACQVCAETIERYPSNVNEVVVCGDECRGTWLSEAYTGEGHPNWKGGGNEPYGEGWNAVREAALERDGYACVLCETGRAALGRNPDVHHIVPVRRFIESAEHEKTDAHALANVVTLCPPCHRRADFGKIPANRLHDEIGATNRRDRPAAGRSGS